MDRQNCSIARYAVFPFQAVWFVVSATVYGAACMITGIFSKQLSQTIGKLWSRQLLRFLGVKITVTGKEKLAPGVSYVFFANHQSALDIPVCFAGLSQPLCFIAKKELFMIPFFGWGMSGMGHVKIDRTNARKARESLRIGVNRLASWRFSLVLFPEGTRSPTGELGEFKQGSFSLALEAGLTAGAVVVPIAICKAHERLPKKSLFVNPGPVYIEICDPVDLRGMDKGRLAAEVRSEIEKSLGLH
jgi:1-acyl-sn-glycerol-3-phosphate acyltransferase